MSENLNIDCTKLWDEILKAIVDVMPEQLFPLFKEVYGKDYPKGTPITILSTEYSTYQESPDAPPGSRLTDITLLVGGTDCYHIGKRFKRWRLVNLTKLCYTEIIIY